jgi:hypothetical protein
MSPNVRIFATPAWALHETLAPRGEKRKVKFMRTDEKFDT